MKKSPVTTQETRITPYVNHRRTDAPLKDASAEVIPNFGCDAQVCTKVKMMVRFMTIDSIYAGGC